MLIVCENLCIFADVNNTDRLAGLSALNMHENDMLLQWLCSNWVYGF